LAGYIYFSYGKNITYKKGLTLNKQLDILRAEQSRAEQSRAEQSRAEQSRAIAWRLPGFNANYSRW